MHFCRSLSREKSYFRIMFKMFLFFFFIILGLQYGICEECSSSEAKSAEAALREKLFCNYNKNIRPVKYFANQTLVQIELYPLKIFMDEYEEKITIHGNIQYVWTDYYLNWDPKEYEDIKVLTVGSENIWLPNIAIDAPSDGMKLHSRIDSGDCLVSHAGKVLCFPVSTINAYCSPNLLRYPFDRHNCSLIFLAQSYTGSYLNLNIFDSGIKLSLFRPNKIWEIINISLRREIAHAGFEDNSTFYPYLKCNIIIQRHSAGHQAIVILPGIVLAGLILLTFFMGDMFETRVAVAATSFVCNVLYCLYFGHQLPSNGDEIPLVVTFFRDSLIISGIAIANATLIQYLQRTTTPAYNWVSVLIHKLESFPLGKVFFFKEVISKEEEVAEIITDTKKKVTVWTQMATVIDKITFLLCLSVYLILFFFFLP